MTIEELWLKIKNNVLIARFDSIRGMLTVPGLISLLGLVGGLIVLSIDDRELIKPFALLGLDFHIDTETARSLVSTIAGASMTTLSLVYSITLLVFTLAAGTVGPRLLQRFTSDRINQITAGVLGATFIYSILILHRIDGDFVPIFSVAIVMILAIVAVILLVIFVHSVARRVTIDEEVAEIAGQLRREFERLVHREEKDDEKPRKDKPAGETLMIEAETDGYIDQFLEADLLELATEHDCYIEFKARPGSFVIPGTPLAELTKASSDELIEDIRGNIVIAPTRRPTGDIEFSINLLVEIALRALSPGINDTFTAIACVDRMTSAMALVVRHGLRPGVLHDDEGVPRVYLGDFDIEQLIDIAFNPLRRAARGNVLMASHIARAIGRLRRIAGDDTDAILKRHLDLLEKETERADILPIDKKFVVESDTDLRQAV